MPKLVVGAADRHPISTGVQREPLWCRVPTPGSVGRVADDLKRLALDLAEYSIASQREPCFICKIIGGTHPVPHEVIYRDDFAIAFLNRFPTLYGYCLVAPIEHRVDVVGDFDEPDYLRLQSIVRRVAGAVGAVVPTERMYVLSLGSNQGNDHVHWHVAPLPPDVPYEDQQFRALMVERNGYIQLDADQQHELADALRRALFEQGSPSAADP